MYIYIYIHLRSTTVQVTAAGFQAGERLTGPKYLLSLRLGAAGNDTPNYINPIYPNFFGQIFQLVRHCLPECDTATPFSFVLSFHISFSPVSDSALTNESGDSLGNLGNYGQ